jgi:serine/threonine protein kinase/tetratricopeptide (TPR) repeat protein
MAAAWYGTTRARRERLRIIVSRAMEQKSLEVSTDLIERLCADDAAMLREAKRLLGRGPDELEEFANVAQRELRREEPRRVGKRIGAYRVLREIGRGGMGAVYLAERADGQFQKQVAIKVLKRGTDTEEILRRFEIERQIVAQLDHPNITRLLDAGTTDDGLPYFIMELAEGVPITQFVERAKLDLRERLQLFAKICSAVESAHRKHIAHRDIKPSNVMVSDDGEPKLLDFGIAKLLARDARVELTGELERRLTPISASPEQLAGQQITLKTDIYSLGALLYEVVTARAPYQFRMPNPSSAEISAVISASEPEPPSRVVTNRVLSNHLRQGVDQIVRRAMRKDPAKRYSSVGQLASDINRYLAGDSVELSSGDAQRWFSRMGALSRNRVWLYVCIPLILAAGAAFVLFWRLDYEHRMTRPLSGVEISPNEKSIAVLPFDALGNGESDGYFVDGVQDNIVTDLARGGGLKIFSRNATLQYRGRRKDIRQIRKSLGVGYVLDGSVRRFGNRLRVNAQLIDAVTEQQIWAERYDRNVDDLFSIQTEVAEKIAAALHTALAPDEKAALWTRPTRDMEAYDLYLRARECIHTSGTPPYRENFLKAVHLLEIAVARDPHFALAYASLSEAHLNVYRWGNDRTPDRLAKARFSAETALRLAPDLPDAHIAQARCYYRGAHDYEKTLKELSLAAPTGEADFFLVASLAERRLGRWREALRDGEKAVEIDPLDPFITTALIETFVALRMYDDAERAADRGIVTMGPFVAAPAWILKAQSQMNRGRLSDARATLEAAPPETEMRAFFLAVLAVYERNYSQAAKLAQLIPRSVSETRVSAMFLEGRIARAKGDAEAAHATFTAVLPLTQTSVDDVVDEESPRSLLGLALAGLGRNNEALQESRRDVEMTPISRDAIAGAVHLTRLAIIEAWSGERAAALKHLSELEELPSSPSYGELRFDPIWDDLRGDPQFEQVIAQAAKPFANPDRKSAQ